MPRTLTDIAELLAAELRGADATVSGVRRLEDAGPTHISLCFDRRHAAHLERTRAAGVIIPRQARGLLEMAPCSALLVDRPRLALAVVLELFHPRREVEPGVLPGAQVDPRASVDRTARVEPGARVEEGASVGSRALVESGAFVGRGARIGEDCRIGANVVIAAGCTLGNRVILGPAAVIGSAGFGFAYDGSAHRPIPQVGSVVIEDDVEIGAGTTVDRGTLGDTRIGAGTKIDNLVQVGHNVIIGRNVLIAAQVGLSGSVRIEDGAMLGGQVGVAEHIVIGAGAQVGAKSGVGSHVPAGARVAGYPAVPVKQWLERAFLWRRMQRALKGFSGKEEGT